MVQTGQLLISEDYLNMYHVLLPSGFYSDILNKTRALDLVRLVKEKKNGTVSS